MTDFSREIANYKNYGTYIYKFDDVGNELVNPSSSIFQQVYFSLPFGNVVYNNAKIESFYDTTFTEFVPQPTSSTTSVFPQEAIDQINAITSDNIRLQDQLLSIVNASEQNSFIADASLIKNIIISLRIQLGQGTTTSDFDTVFPYMAIPVELRDSTTSVQVVPSSAASTIQPTIITATSIVSNTAQPGINESGESINASGQLVSNNTGVGQMTDSEIMTISGSVNINQSLDVNGNIIVKYVIPSIQFGSSIIGGITYYRVILVGSYPGKNDDSRGNPLHGQYINMTNEQIRILSDDKQSILINKRTYKSISNNSVKYWCGKDTKKPNGNSVIQNWEHYNGPDMLPNADRWKRYQQTGFIGALGPQ